MKVGGFVYSDYWKPFPVREINPHDKINLLGSIVSVTPPGTNLDVRLLLGIIASGNDNTPRDFTGSLQVQVRSSTNESSLRNILGQVGVTPIELDSPSNRPGPLQATKLATEPLDSSRSVYLYELTLRVPLQPPQTDIPELVTITSGMYNELDFWRWARDPVPYAESLAAVGQPWIATNAIGWHDRHTNSLDLEMTPSLATNVPNYRAYYNKAARLFLHLGEGVVVGARGSATYGSKVVASYDIRTDSPGTNPRMLREEIRTIWQTNRVLLKADYYRGRVYYPGTKTDTNEWMTVFSSVDNKRVVALWDSGPIHYSEDAGLSWTILSSPGEYEFALSTTPAGSKIVAVLTVTDPREVRKGSTVRKMATRYWYSAASAADGNQLVLTGGEAAPAPVLSISHQADEVVLSWPVSSGSFIVQQTVGISAPQWEEVTNAISIVGSENQLRIPAAAANNFFRLKTR